MPSTEKISLKSINPSALVAFVAPLIAIGGMIWSAASMWQQIKAHEAKPGHDVVETRVDELEKKILDLQWKLKLMEVNLGLTSATEDDPWN